jgi:hypothetical protein
VRVVALVVAALAVTGCNSQSQTVPGDGATGATSLEISISLGVKDAPTKLWTLRCPTGGTLPDAARACVRLDELDDPFGPLPKDVACTEIYGGPQVADVQGTFRGEPVNTRFTRTNGCEIARWNSVRFLFPDT